MGLFHYDSTKKTLEIKPHDQADGTLDASALIEYQSTTKGILPVRMTTAQRNAISSPATGLELFDTDLGNKVRYNGSGWITIPIQMPIEIMFAGGTNSDFNTVSATYVQAGIFRFGGTTTLSTPTKIKAIGWKDAATTSWDMQVIDITNSLTIVTKTGNTGNIPEIVDLGALSNLPASEAMFEVQLKRAGGTGGNMVHIHSLSVEF
jgi:hypothetical protein